PLVSVGERGAELGPDGPAERLAEQVNLSAQARIDLRHGRPLRSGMGFRLHRATHSYKHTTNGRSAAGGELVSILRASGTPASGIRVVPGPNPPTTHGQRGVYEDPRTRPPLGAERQGSP